MSQLILVFLAEFLEDVLDDLDQAGLVDASEEGLVERFGDADALDVDVESGALLGVPLGVEGLYDRARRVLARRNPLVKRIHQTVSLQLLPLPCILNRKRIVILQ